MDTESSLHTALHTLAAALTDFQTAHPALAMIVLLIYITGVLFGSVVLCSSLGDLRGVSWLPNIFLTDGVLICCCPLAAVLPILLWPLVIIGNILLFCLRWFLAAPTFCGIRREAFIKPYKICARTLRRWGRERRAKKQRRGLLPVANGARATPQTGYGAISVGRPQLDREPCGCPRSHGTRSSRQARLQPEIESDVEAIMRYARQQHFQSDVESVRSAPPPYQ